MVTLAFVVFSAVLLACFLAVWGRPGEGIGLPFIAILSFGYLYLEQPLELLWNGNLEFFLNPTQISVLLLAAAIMLACFVWGWQKGISRGETNVSCGQWDPTQLWWAGFISALVGSALLFALVMRSGGFEQAFATSHGSSLALDGVTAYMYLSPWWIVSGCGMMVFGLYSSEHTTRWQLLTIIGFVGILYALSVLTSSRGWAFTTTGTLTASFALAKGRRPSIMQTAPVWVAAGMAALLLVGYRAVLNLSDDRPEAPTLIEAITAGTKVDATHESLHMTGNEFVYAAALLDTVNQERKCDWGREWLYTLTIHAIPRVLWPDRPEYDSQDSVSWDDISAVTGINVAGGAAPSIVGDIYQNFWFLSPVFFGLFGWVSAILYTRAQDLGTPFAVCSYALVCGLSLNIFAQGFGAILVPLPYALLPMFLFYVFNRLSHSDDRDGAFEDEADGYYRWSESGEPLFDDD